jgi:hypothetical protein
MVSYSNEFNLHYANGNINDKVNSLTQSSNCYVVEVVTTSISDFVAVTVDSTPSFEFGRYNINNDYNLENTNVGNAYAKHLTTTVNFAALAEDIRVQLDVYRPPNTDIQVFARIQNSSDPQAFTGEDFTRLNCVSGSRLYSSPSTIDDYIEMDFGFPGQPNTATTLTGTITTTNASAVITGSNTVFTGNVAVGQLIKIYDPLFPNTNFIIASANVVTDNTHITIDQLITSNVSIGGNPALVGTGLIVDVLGFNNQAYNNITNDNVARYYNTSTVKYDGFDIMQLKIVMLSAQPGMIPRIHDIRALGVSA